VARASADAGDWREPFVEEHLLALYRHVRLVYPLVSAESTVLEVLRRAAAEPLPDNRSRAWLRRLARSVAYGDDTPEPTTIRRNAAAIIIDLLDFVESLDFRSDHADLVLALETMEPLDQELLRMITVEILSDDELAAILGISAAEAASRRLAAVARLETALEQQHGATGGQLP